MLFNYYHSKEELGKFHLVLKQEQCPQCHQVGFLILFGFLYGLPEEGDGREVRGRRYFCNNRKCRKGCGRTFSILLDNILRNKTFRAHSLWRFLEGILNKMCRKPSFEGLGLNFSLTTGYRLWNEFCRSQSRIRSFLIRRGVSFYDPKIQDPFLQGIAHLRAVFHPECPIAAFQSNFQVSFLGS